MRKSPAEMVALRKDIAAFLKNKKMLLSTFSDKTVGYSLKPFMAREIKALRPYSVDRIRAFIARNSIADAITKLSTTDLIKIGVGHDSY